GGFGALFILYCTVLGCGGRRTLGKALMGIAVVNKDTLQPLGFVKSFLRALGYIIGLITAFGGFALALLNKRRRAVQDLIGGSIVISTREKGAAESVVTAALGTALMALCVFCVYYSFFVAPSSYQKMLVANADNELERIAQVQIYHRVVYGYYTPDIVRLGLISGDPVQFQREIQRNLKRRGFSMGVGNDGFTLKAVAKDKNETEVSLNYTD
ncbi:MAG: RDD family protein, partial [Elusimicrobiota bacterium]|nr:RDD family protein [Elusimicrobiota bacterium]